MPSFEWGHRTSVVFNGTDALGSFDPRIAAILAVTGDVHRLTGEGQGPSAVVAVAGDELRTMS